MSAICVYCSSSESIDTRYLDLAAEVGAKMAAAGHSLVYGGGRVSMMGALADAVRAGGGSTTGVIPRALMPRELADPGAGELIVVGTMRERKQIMDERSDAVLALPGGIGTLEELFEMWTSAYLGMHDKPVIVLDPGDFYAPLWLLVQRLREQHFVTPGAVAALHRARSTDEALALLP